MNGPFVLALRRGIIYEGNGHHFMRAIHLAPTITEAQCNFYKNEQGASRQSLIFREDSFDPISRIRRGRFYHVAETLYPPVKNVHNYPFGELIGIMNNFDAEAWYSPISSQDVSAWSSPSCCQVTLGQGKFQTTWRAISAEMISSGDLLWTLKAVSTMGALPALRETLTSKTGKIIEAGHIQTAIDKLADALHVQQPVSIVDGSRETAKIILTAWLGPEAEGKDLGNVIKIIHVDEHSKESMVGLAAKIINRLHPRGKSAEQEKRALRQVIDEDAEASVHLIGLLLREIGWAKA